MRPGNYTKFFRLLLVLMLPLTGCGYSPSGSSLKDEVDPTGEHETHFFGTINFKQRDNRLRADAVPGFLRFEAYALPNGESGNTFLSEKIPNQDVLSFPIKVLKGKVVTSGLYHKPNNGYDRKYFPKGYSFKPSSQDFNIHLELKRIDVRDMLITRQDGTTYYQKGIYDVLVIGDDGEEKVGSYLYDLPTNSGVDVLAGYKYRVRVSVRSDEGILQKQTFDLDYRN
jgi:hypothetical protein